MCFLLFSYNASVIFFFFRALLSFSVSSHYMPLHLITTTANTILRPKPNRLVTQCKHETMNFVYFNILHLSCGNFAFPQHIVPTQLLARFLPINLYAARFTLFPWKVLSLGLKASFESLLIVFEFNGARE